MNYQLLTGGAFFIGCVITAIIILIVFRYGVMLMEIFKTLNAVSRLNKSYIEEREKNQILNEKVEELELENKELKLKIQKQDDRISSLEEVMEKQRNQIKLLAAADRDLDEWRDMAYHTLSTVSDLSPELIYAITGRKKGDKKGPL
jgi:small-conductance mechanosensitive channel